MPKFYDRGVKLPNGRSVKSWKQLRRAPKWSDRRPRRSMTLRACGYRVEFNKEELDIGGRYMAGGRPSSLIPLRARIARLFITLSKSRPDRRPSSKKCPAVFAVSHLLVAKAISCLNTSCCERQLAFKMAAAHSSTRQLPLPARARARTHKIANGVSDLDQRPLWWLSRLFAVAFARHFFTLMFWNFFPKPLPPIFSGGCSTRSGEIHNRRPPGNSLRASRQ